MINDIVKILVDLIGYGGYPGIFLLMFLESSFFPFPSEIVIPPAAYLAYKGSLSIYAVILFGTLGSLLGALFNYYISYKLGLLFFLKYGKYFGVNKNTIDKASLFFQKHGEISTFIGRLLPAIRQYISIPAGLSKMNIVSFSIFTFFGALVWVLVLASIGYLVGNNPQLVGMMLHKSYIYIIVFSLILIGLYILFRRWHDRRI